MFDQLLALGRLTLVEWAEDRDLRRVGKEAKQLLQGRRPGEAVLVTNSRFGRYGERFRILVKDRAGRCWVLVPPGQDGLESLFVKLHKFVGEVFA